MFSSTCAFEVMRRIRCFAHPAAIVKRRFYFQPFAAEDQRTRVRLQQCLPRPVHRPKGSREADFVTAGCGEKNHRLVNIGKLLEL